MSEARPAASGWLERWGRLLEEHRLVFQGGIDGLCWLVGVLGAMFLRFELAFDPRQWGPFNFVHTMLAVGLVLLIQVAAGLTSGLYAGKFRYGSFEEVAHLVRAVAVVTVLFAGVNRLLPDQLIPTSVVFIGGGMALLAMAAVRYTWRLALERSRRPSDATAERTLVFGAGDGGEQLVTSMVRNPDSPFLPVGLLDDDPSKRKLRIRGVPVVGTRAEVVHAARDLDATVLCIAVPSAPAELIRDLAEAAAHADLDVRVLPALSELLSDDVGLADLRPVTEEDLLGRHRIDTDIDAIAGYLTNRSVLVTGAGGSIGSELCRQIARFAPRSLVMLDRDESALHAVQLSIDGRALLDTRELVVADIRDRQALDAAFDEHRPDVVFHAAALKHLPLLELYPEEAYKTNVVGTQLVLDAAAAVGVERFVNISTDKAADPTSVLGFTKRIAERLTAGHAEAAPGTYLSVRFGNVLGSRGSVLTAFRAQAAAGGPITVTDPDVTRYFMTIEEAVQLVVQAGAVGRDGEALVLDMGEPVRIDDVARRLAAQAPRPVDIVYTGLRRGEKLHEQLLGRDEVDVRPAHPLISQVDVPPLRFDAVVAGHATVVGDADLIIELRNLAVGADDVGADEPAHGR